MKIETIFDKTESSIVPELKLHFKNSRIKRHLCGTTDKLVELLKELFDKGTMDIQEETILLILNNLDSPICYYKLSKGSKYSVSADPKLIFQILLSVSADKFVFAHNHPNGIPFPSLEDLKSSHTIGLMASFFDIDFVDDIIIAKEGYFSLSDEGLLWE